MWVNRGKNLKYQQGLRASNLVSFLHVGGYRKESRGATGLLLRHLFLSRRWVARGENLVDASTLVSFSLVPLTASRNLQSFADPPAYNPFRSLIRGLSTLVTHNWRVREDRAHYTGGCGLPLKSTTITKLQCFSILIRGLSTLVTHNWIVRDDQIVHNYTDGCGLPPKSTITDELQCFSFTLQSFWSYDPGEPAVSYR